MSGKAKTQIDSARSTNEKSIGFRSYQSRGTEGSRGHVSCITNETGLRHLQSARLHAVDQLDMGQNHLHTPLSKGCLKLIMDVCLYWSE